VKQFVVIKNYEINKDFKMIKEITKLKRQFLWGWGYEGKKMAWIKWETICKSKESGGLRIKDLACFNKVLLGKWK